MPQNTEQKSSKVRLILHSLMAFCGLVLAAQPDLPTALAFLPADSKWPKYVGYVLALAAFTRVMGKRAGLVAATPSAPVPVQTQPSDELPAAVEILPDPEKPTA